MGKIVMEFSESKVSLNLEENLWRVKEADNYYADADKIRKLQESLQNARLGYLLSNTQNAPGKWVLLKVYSKNDQIVDKFKIGYRPQTKTFYVKQPHQPEIYRINWKMELFDQPQSWTYQPLISLKERDISQLEKNGISIMRQEEGASFYEKQTNLPYNQFSYHRFFDLLSDLHYEKVLSSQDFDTSRFTSSQTIKITTFEGLKIVLSLYHDDREYWAKIKMLTTRLPSFKVVEEVDNQQFLYQDWWFKLNDDIGRQLWRFKIKK